MWARATSYPLPAVETRQIVTGLWDMAVNDYVEQEVFQSSGGSLSITSSGFMLVRVG